MHPEHVNKIRSMIDDVFCEIVGLALLCFFVVYEWFDKPEGDQ